MRFFLLSVVRMTVSRSIRTPSAVNGSSLFAKRDSLLFLSAEVIFKIYRHCQNYSKQPFKQRKQGKWCLSGGLPRRCYCVKSEFFCPRCFNEKLFVANNCRPRDAAAAREQKAVMTNFVLCRAFSFFWAPKEHDRTTIKRTHNNSLRVRCTCEYNKEIPPFGSKWQNKVLLLYSCT